ncbi:hypothetical protein Tco_0359155 [Tanacetum coccineum]
MMTNICVYMFCGHNIPPPVFWQGNLTRVIVAAKTAGILAGPEPYRNMASVSDPADKQSGNTWIARHVITKDPTVLCCILLDKEGLYSTYRISRFSCEETKKLESLPSTMSNPIITGDPTKTRTVRRIIDIQNLDGMSIPFIIWNEVAQEFDVKEYNKMEKPVVIPVSSCWVTRKYGEVHHILNVYQQFIDPAPALPIQQPPYGDEEQEQTRNQWSLESLLKVIPHNYKPRILCLCSCNNVVNALNDNGPNEIPPPLKEVEGMTHVFQFYFGKGANPDLGSLAIAPSVRLVDLPLPSIDSKPRVCCLAADSGRMAESEIPSRRVNGQVTLHNLLQQGTKCALQLGGTHKSTRNPHYMSQVKVQPMITSGHVAGLTGRFKIKKKRQKNQADFRGLLVFEAREIERVERLGAEKGADKGFSVSDIEGRCDA